MADSASGAARRVQAGGGGLDLGPQGDAQAVAEERDEDVGLNPVLELVVDRPQVQVGLERPERLLDADQLHVPLPQYGGPLVHPFGEVGPGNGRARRT
jgi:hypothetical protein